MCFAEIVGWMASGLVFAAFYMEAMVPLRLVAIASNVAFIGYGYLGDLTPILLLHLGLLPLNAWRLCEATWPPSSEKRNQYSASPTLPNQGE
ncbi:MAG TPA: cyclic nucleotide-binding protein [Hyphomicrobiaceae bacterium]|jgi:hypothetical protein